MGRVVHFEIHGAEPEKLAAFYRSVFGWQVSKLPNMEYWLVVTGDETAPGINGGILKRRGTGPVEGQSTNAYVCTIETGAIDQDLKRGTQEGGSIVVPKMVIPGVGWVAYLKDPAGNTFGLHQRDKSAR
jgi:predicted enzyme related to lactoylglutathione lyase